MNRRRQVRPHITWRNLVLLLVLMAGVGLVVGGLVFRGWSRIELATPAQAASAFADQFSQIVDQRPYLTIADAGTVGVDRTLEQGSESEVQALWLLAYEPGAGRLVRVRFPFWFVKLKTTNQLNLGTLVSLLSSDWEHLDLAVTQNDLAQRGPGLVLDHTRTDGGRILLWSE